ncbi:MAG: cobyric acid synthase, partial [Aedoeadaptatus pacaensis]
MVNMGFAKAADIPAILIADIDRGGMFASVVGTWELFDEDERRRLKGIVVNRFRGDVSILEPGLKILEERTGVPVLGVVPYADVRLEAEDSLAMEFHETDRGAVDIAVIHLPHISNVTDVAPFQIMDDVRVRTIAQVEEFGEPDLLIIPGTKNTMADLKWLKETGIYARILRHAERGGSIFSICGGFQMMGDTLSDPEGVESGGTMEGLKLFPMDTVFTKEKKQCRVETTITASEGLLKNLSGTNVTGYEIHMGKSKIREGADIEPLTESGGIAINGRLYGTYIHGFFDAPHIAEGIVAALKKEKDLPPKETMDYAAFKDSQIEKLAAVVEEALDMKKLDEILGLL